MRQQPEAARPRPQQLPVREPVSFPFARGGYCTFAPVPPWYGRWSAHADDPVSDGTEYCLQRDQFLARPRAAEHGGRHEWNGDLARSQHPRQHNRRADSDRYVHLPFRLLAEQLAGHEQLCREPRRLDVQLNQQHRVGRPVLRPQRRDCGGDHGRDEPDRVREQQLLGEWNPTPGFSGWYMYMPTAMPTSADQTYADCQACSSAIWYNQTGGVGVRRDAEHHVQSRHIANGRSVRHHERWPNDGTLVGRRHGSSLEHSGAAIQQHPRCRTVQPGAVYPSSELVSVALPSRITTGGEVISRTLTERVNHAYPSFLAPLVLRPPPPPHVRQPAASSASTT